MPTKAPTFFAIARQPKWIGALLLALAVAAIFALLGQWQLDRAFTKSAPTDTDIKISTVNVMIDSSHVFIAANRLQDGEQGYWLLSNSRDEAGKSVTLALGWSPSYAEVKGEYDALKDSVLVQAFMPMKGVFLPSEAPKPLDSKQPYLLQSVSLAQLVNLYSPDKPVASHPEYLALCGCDEGMAWPPLRPIKVNYAQTDPINWLSAFYFLEWTVFAGFAVFMWWRLVKDQLIRDQLETVN
ncbi:SURF1 family cytochrome oxidase biogenesis protein [Rhodoluna sp.]|uniref:SURF1 family cytochrome oxidase biogenesis protein n=1 Tax=Rhodoluna sp. TaxID=1969481 RepID=UPI0025E12594|nr:SURF1 family cytochrome oxidase biogenesis protein [Rhodoluna sp.]